MDQSKTILWAVDPFESHPRAVAAALRFLEALAKESSLEVHPVHVIDPSSERWEGESPHGSPEAAAKSLLQERLKGNEHPWLKDPIVLSEPGGTVRAAVQRLVEFAREYGFSAILAVKHSGKTPHTGILGSFAENLAYLSPLPVFFVYPRSDAPAEIHNVFFASDGETDGEVFQQLVGLLGETHPEVRVHSYILAPFEQWLGEETIHDFEGEKRAALLEKMKEFETIASPKGVSLKLVAKRSDAELEAKILEDSEKEQSDLIVMPQKNRGLVGQLMGRFTREVLRHSTKPVLVLHPQQ